MYSFMSSTLFSMMFSLRRPPPRLPPPDDFSSALAAGAAPGSGVFCVLPSAPYATCFCSCFLTSPFRLICVVSTQVYDRNAFWFSASDCFSAAARSCGDAGGAWPLTETMNNGNARSAEAIAPYLMRRDCPKICCMVYLRRRLSVDREEVTGVDSRSQPGGLYFCTDGRWSGIRGSLSTVG